MVSTGLAALAYLGLQAVPAQEYPVMAVLASRERAALTGCMERYRLPELTECMEKRLAKTPASRELTITVQPATASTVRPGDSAASAGDFSAPLSETLCMHRTLTVLQRISAAMSPSSEAFPNQADPSRSITLSIQQVSTSTTLSSNRRT